MSDTHPVEAHGEPLVAEMDAKAMLAWLRERTGEMADLLGRLARAESPSLDPESQNGVFEILSSELSGLGFSIDRLPGQTTGDHLLATPIGRSEGEPYQLMLGHLDTVWPTGTITRMPVRARDGLLFGPGVFDMKGGLVQMLFAVRALSELGTAPSCGPLALINADEEIGSVDSRAHIERLARGAARAFVLEPSFGPAGKLKTARKGVGSFTLRVSGVASHAGLDPEGGVSAILEASHQIQRLFGLNDPDRRITVNVGTIDGGLRRNVVAPEVRAEVEARVVTMADAAEVEQGIRSLSPITDGISLEIEGGFGRPPLERTPRNRGLWELARAAAAKLDIEIEEALVGGASDGNFASTHTATLDGLGAVGEGAHAEHEHVVVDRMPERAALLALLLASPLKR